MEYIIGLMPSLMEGLRVTFSVFFITLIISIPLGVLVALGSLSKIKTLNMFVRGYVLIMRGTPLLLQIIFIFFGLPLLEITLNRTLSILIAFSLNYGAYFGEIFRGGIQSIDKGQYEACEVLNMSYYVMFKKIILPQTIKKILPAISNEVITLVKDTSLVYAVGLNDILRVAKIASNRDVSLLPLAVTGVIYLLLTVILTKIFNKLESSYAYYS